MLYDLLEYLDQFDWRGAGLYKYISFRAGAAIIFSLIISLIFGGRIIRYLRRLQIGETVRDLGLAGQKEKEGTPTMGGIIIIMAIIIPCLLWANLENVYIVLMLVATSWMAIIGFVDDYIKVFKKDKEGLSGRFKILGQVVLGLIVALTMLFSEQVVVRMDPAKAASLNLTPIEINTVTIRGAEREVATVRTTMTNVPFLKGNELDYSNLIPFAKDNAASLVWIIFVPVVVIIVTAVSNAANLTDGLDGLATGVSAIIGATLGVLAYVSSNAIAADYLNILFFTGC